MRGLVVDSSEATKRGLKACLVPKQQPPSATLPAAPQQPPHPQVAAAAAAAAAASILPPPGGPHGPHPALGPGAPHPHPALGPPLGLLGMAAAAGIHPGPPNGNDSFNDVQVGPRRL